MSYDPSYGPLSDTDLLGLGVRSCAQKVGEKAVEAALAAVTVDDEQLVAELADLWFHSYVVLAPTGSTGRSAHLAVRTGARMVAMHAANRREEKT